MEKNPDILVTHDFSAGSKYALDYGIEFAAENNAQLHFLHVEVLDNVELPSLANKTKAQQLREKLQADIKNSLDKQGLKPEDLNSIKYTVLREMAAGPAIIDYCKKYKIDLVVMGTHGRRGISRKILGSVAEEVVRLAPCTVFTIREQLEFKSLAESLKTIAVPFDFSDHSRLALAYARELASSFNARLDVIHVIEEKLHPAFYQAGIASVYDNHPDLPEKVQKELESILNEPDAPDVEKTITVLSGHPVNEIINHVETGKHDLIVIATHGLSGMERVVLGSVTERVIRQATCPVITVKNNHMSDKQYSTFTEDASAMSSS